MIKTSVIIPVYNTSPYIEECIDSVFAQTQKEIEVIVVNDGSTDDSLEILMCMQEKYPQLTIVSQENHGLGYTRNVGIEKARGQYIYFLDSDDFILSDTLETCYKCAQENQLDVVLFDAMLFEDSKDRKQIVPNICDRHEIIEEREEIFSGIKFLEKYYPQAYHPESCLMYYSADFIKKNGMKFLPRVYFEDNEFYCRTMILAERAMYIPRMFYRYRCRSSSIMGMEFNLRKARDHIEVVSAIADLKTLNESRAWNIVHKIAMWLLQYVASACQSNALYAQDRKLYVQIVDTWAKICGNTIECTESLEDIESLNRICDCFPDSNGITEALADRRRNLLILRLRKLCLNQKGCRVAIYGCGEYTDKVMDFYEKWVGTIDADIFFIDSYVVNDSTRYRGYAVYPVSKIAAWKLDCILISSPKYEEEMKQIIQRLYGDRFELVLLYGGMHIFI